MFLVLWVLGFWFGVGLESSRLVLVWLFVEVVGWYDGKFGSISFRFGLGYWCFLFCDIVGIICEFYLDYGWMFV